MKQCKTKVVTVLLAAILGLSALLGFAGANRNTASAAVGEEEPVKIGASLPYTIGFYQDLAYNLADELTSKLGKKYNLDIMDNEQSATRQIDQINFFIDEGYDAIIVSPVDADAIASVLWEAYKAGIFIVVIGKPNSNYPPSGIVYETQDYYTLGKNHAKSIAAETLTPDIANFVVFYYIDENGSDYLRGFKDGLQEYGLVGNIHEYIISDYDSITSFIEAWIVSHDSAERNEMVTYDGNVASIILQTYYDKRYRDNSPGEGTGIRALPDPQASDGPNPTKETAEKIADALSAMVNDQEFPPADAYYNGNPIYYIPFAPALSKYVI